ncbi:MAG: RMD1 family protein [Deltaproteobacteria bacterium]|nr:RMD1 family protein [Deltaproteobacteria bacterium]
MATGYLMQAINLYDSIHIKSIRSVLSGRIVDSSPRELRLQYGENSYLFVYRFGCLVFFNMSNEEIDLEVGKIKSVLGPGLPNPTTETYQVNVGDFPNRVEFEYVEVHELSLDILRLVAISVGQSAALEYFEVMANRMLNEASSFMEDLATLGEVSLKTKSLLKMIGTSGKARQHIISNVAILDPPDETWKSKELEEIFIELQENFDIEVRFRTLDKKLTLIQDNIEILADFTSSRRTIMLEASVVALILIEIVLALLHKR